MSQHPATADGVSRPGQRHGATARRVAPQQRKPTDVRTREILDVAARLFAERGYAETTMRNICAAVGLTLGSLYYHVESKETNPSWHVPNSAWAGKLAGRVIPPGPDNPIKARWLGIFDGAGIHGIDPSEYGTIGHAASHGCVRMRIPDVVDLYPRVPVGAPIYIA